MGGGVISTKGETEAHARLKRLAFRVGTGARLFRLRNGSEFAEVSLPC